ncbi:MAG: ferritin-like domain-containing protein [Thermomicrobiales bacterium]
MSGSLQARLAHLARSQNGACESVQDIINIAATAEALAVTAMGGALQSAIDGNLDLNEEQQQVVAAARAAEQTHYDFLVGAGAEALTLEFTLPDEAIVTDVGTLITTVVGLEEAFIAAYMAAAQTFAILGEPDLVAYSLQTAAVEGEHRAHMRFYGLLAGLYEETPNNIAFHKGMFTSVGGAAQALTDLGWIGGSGAVLSFPGPGEVDLSIIENLQP